MRRATRRRLKWLAVLFLASAVAWFSASFSIGASQAHIAKHAFDLRNSVVPLSTSSISDPNDVQHWGTAFVVDNDGTLVTADHVVSDLKALIASRHDQDGAPYLSFTARQAKNKSSYDSIPVTVVAERPEIDLAILRMPQLWAHQINRMGEDFVHFEPLPIDTRSEPAIGETVRIAGYPELLPYVDAEARGFQTPDIPGLVMSLHLDPIVTTAHIAGASRLMSAPSQQTSWHMNTKQSFLILDHECPPGGSGGPIISIATQRVVGVAVRSAANGYCFAVKAVDLNAALSDAKKTAIAAP